MSLRSGLLWIAAVLTMVGSVLGGENDKRIRIPEDVFYYQPAASVFGSEAAWINPAGLGRYDIAGFQLMGEYYNGDYAKSWAAAIFRERVTTAYRHLHNPVGDNYDEWLVAMGTGVGRSLNLGASYRYFRNGPGIFNNRQFFTLGAIARGGGKFSFGAVLSNLNRGKVNGERTAMEERYSVAYRPMGNRVTLSADMFFSSKNKLSEADFIYHAEIIPTGGLYISASVDSDRNFEVGFRTNLLRYFVGSRSGFNRDGHDGRTTVFAGAIDSRQPSLVPERKRRLSLRVSGRPEENPPRPVFGTSQTSFAELLIGVYEAAADDNISEMVLDLRGLSLGFGQAQELRRALDYFQSRGKRIVSHLSSPNNIAYYVASIADTILISPVSQLRLVGLRAELTFWAGTLDKLGVRLELLQIGDYKTAPEKWTRRAATEENRAQINMLLDDWYDQFVQAIADSRGFTADSVRRIIDNGPFTSEEALRFGLVDGLSYRDRVVPDFCQTMPEVTLRRYRADTLVNDSWRETPVVAVVVADGDITADGGSLNPLQGVGGVTPSEMAHAFGQAGRTHGVKGMVLRINSPGGDALAGEVIHRQEVLAADEMPLVVSMGNVAASGGYYIAMPAGYVFANPATVTGSIGIYGGKADFSSLYEKISLGKELYTRGRYAGMLTTIRPFTSDERDKYYGDLEAFYDHFVDLVAQSRSLPHDSVDNLGEGRVWTGRQALNGGLVDELGGLRQACDYVADLAGLEEYRVELYPRRRPLIILPEMPLLNNIISLFSHEKPTVETVFSPLSLGDEAYVLARMPFDIDVE